MRSDYNTREIGVGDRIDLPNRAVIVASNDDTGIGVVWYTPQGLGPYHAVLPHGIAFRRRYHVETNGHQESWWDVHPDMTGKTGEI